MWSCWESTSAKVGNLKVWKGATVRSLTGAAMENLIGLKVRNLVESIVWNQTGETVESLKETTGALVEF